MAVQIPSLAEFTSLERLELSYNQISSLQPLQGLSSTALSELYVANNAVQKIEVRCSICTTPICPLCTASMESVCIVSMTFLSLILYGLPWLSLGAPVSFALAWQRSHGTDLHFISLELALLDIHQSTMAIGGTCTSGIAW